MRRGRGLWRGTGTGMRKDVETERCVWLWVLAGRVRVCICSMGLIEQIGHQTRF